MSKLIPLSGNRGEGLFATVDDDMFEQLSKHSWHLACGRYAAMRTKDGLFHMHRVVAGAVKGEEVDHTDGEGLNNQRSNLRKCTHQQNVWNSKPYSSTGYRGVMKNHSRFFAQLHHSGGVWKSPQFNTVVEAAAAYNEKAKEVYGEFAWLNPIENLELTSEHLSKLTRQTQAERPFTKRNTTGLHGVSRHKATGRWFGSVTHQGTVIKTSLCDTSEDAAYLFDQIALQLRGDRAKLNVPFD